MKIQWLEHKIPNKASLVSTVAWITIVTIGLGGLWRYAVGASVVALTVDKFAYEIKIAGEN